MLTLREIDEADARASEAQSATKAIRAFHKDVPALCETARQLMQERDQVIELLRLHAAAYFDEVLVDRAAILDSTHAFLAQVTKGPQE